MYDIKQFACGLHHISPDADLSGVPVEPVDVNPVSSESPLLDMIYAPDPITGVPRSDLAFMFMNDKSAEVNQFIRDTLMSPVQSSGGVDDPDMALVGIKSRTESFEQYVKRLKEYAVNEP